jgi:hypothetical protein
MRKLLYTLILCVTMSTGIDAQIKLIGASYNTGTSSVELIQWAAFDSSSVEATPTTLDAYLYASSAFDPFNGNYYIAGISGESSGLYSFNSDSGEGNLTTTSMITNTAEFDMSTSKMYNLLMETEGYISIYAYNLETSQDSLIGTIYEPGVIGIVADAIGFDSNNGILYYVGYTNDPSIALYAIPVRADSFSYTKTTLNSPYAISNITSVNYDNVNERLFATNDAYDENANYTGRKIVEIDLISGDIITLGELTEFPYFVGSSSLFDQNSGTFLLVGITNSNEYEMIAFDTFNNTYITGFVPENVSEIACDNTLFARNFYGLSGIEKLDALDFTVYPNPVSDALNIVFESNELVQLQIFNSLGALVYEKNSISDNQMNVDVTTFSPGLYTIHLIGSKHTDSQKILVK